MKNHNKWKKIGSIILAVCLVATLLLSNQMSGVFAEEDSTEESTSETSEAIETEKKDEETQKDVQEKEETNANENTKDTVENKENTSKTSKKKASRTKKADAAVQSDENSGAITFDLAKGKVVFRADNTYVGYDAAGKLVTGEHKDSNVYEIEQSDSKSTDNTINIETANMHGKDILPKNQGSTYNITLNQININCSSKPHIPSDGTCEGVEITSRYYRTLEQQQYYYQNNLIYSPILAGDDTVSVNITLVGKNELYAQTGAGATLQYAHYPMGKVGNGALTINGDGKLTVTQSVSGSVNRGACIGGPMLYMSGAAVRTGNGKLIFKGGSISAETDKRSYSAAIGGGSCSPVEKPIIVCGSTVIAQSFNTSATIGAGGGSSGIGEDAGDIKIESGNVTVYSSESGVGIGAGSSESRSGGEAKNIEISGGNVTVYGVDNTSHGKIGGGTSSNIGTEVEERNGGAANITISGGIVVAGTIGGGNTNAQDAKGGNAVIKVKDNANITTETIGGGEANTGKGGNAEVIISGGNLNVQETIGGGNANSGAGGDAAIYVSGGSLDCASIGGGNSISGTPGSVTSDSQTAGVVVTGGILKTGTIGGGTNENKEIGFATADISGGKIQGQFILANTETDKRCFFHMTGGTIDNKDLGTGKYMKAQENGGAVYLSDPNGEVNISGGIIQNATAELGGAVYMTNGSFTLSGDGTIQNCTARDGGGAYLDGGNLIMSGRGAFTSNGASDDGGGAYLAGGTLTINGGSFGNNTATNGGAAYAADGKVRMFGGNITNNKATKDGGGFYVSSDKQAADVVIRSGTISGNKAGDTDATDVQGNGGAIAVVSNDGVGENQDRVVVGLRHKHPDLDTTTRKFTAFSYTDTVDTAKHDHDSCPIMKDNQASGNGGGIYMNSGVSTIDIYCLLEENNTAKADEIGGSIMSVGGNVNIGDVGDDGKGNNTETAVGNILVKSPMLVKGGVVKIYGNTDNPEFTDKILVDIKREADSFDDYRYTKRVNAERSYKVEFFENFEGSGAFISEQYEKKDDIVAMGNMYEHKGYKIVGWKTTDKDGEEKRYNVGEPIASEKDHTAWDGKEDTEALRLYAIWEKTSYIVRYEPGAEKYSGTMEWDTFQYGVKQPLKPNAYKVIGKRFLFWKTTDKDGNEKIYQADYDESMMSGEDRATVTLYAQWADCTHKAGEHPGALSYTVNETTHTITETCDCGAYTASVRLSGADVYYDGSAHPAKLTYTGTLLSGNPTVKYEYKSDSAGDYAGISEEPKEVGYYKASIMVEGKTTFVEYQIKSPADEATIDVTAKKGQHFDNFQGNKGCTVAQDDAFTVQFDVQGLNHGSNEDSKNVEAKGYKTAPVLTLSKALPAGTTMILQYGKDYWYDNNPSGTEIDLSSFVKMGAESTQKFTYDTSNISDTQQYRFIIDFSDVSDSDALPAGTDALTVGLKYAYTNPSTDKVEADKNKEEKAKVAIGTKADFSLTPSEDATTYTVKAPSEITDTRWEEKNLVWKVTSKDASGKLPDDARLKLSTTENGESKTAIYSMNKNGEFIIPFDWTGDQAFTFTLSSSQQSVSNKKYKLTATLCVGSKINQTTQPTAVEDRLAKVSKDLELTVPVTVVPSLKISGGEKVLSKSEKLNVMIAYQDVDGYLVNAIIQKKDSDGVYKGKYYETTITQEGNHDFSLQATDGNGSYRLLVSVSRKVSDTSYQTWLEVPYYFIVQE